jgi:hypothetical protein
MTLALPLFHIIYQCKRLFAIIDDNCEMFRTFRRMLGYIRVKGVFEVECRDKDGKVKWKNKAYNGVTTVGLNHILNVQFFTTAKSSTWFLGLISTSGFTALAAADTMALHGGWTESVLYSSATRPIWVTIAAAAGVITNTAATAFTITGADTIKGFFAVDNSTKGGATGILWATALFGTGDQAVVATDVLNVTYTITLT